MFCLLCNELQIDSITLTSPEAKRQRISSLLWKHFRFCFDEEPTDGDLCRNCWQKLSSFHEFYIRIESVHEQTNRIASCTFTIKEEDIEEDDEQITQLYDSESSFKYEPMLFEDSTSENSKINLSDEIVAQRSDVIDKPLPDKSRDKYLNVYNTFLKWKESQNIEKSNCSETVMLAYFKNIQKKYKPTSLWAFFSMLKATIQQLDNVDIRYSKLVSFLKKNMSGFVTKKSKVFSPAQINTFLSDAPDIDYLVLKLVLIFGIYGATRGDELLKVSPSDVELHGEEVIVVKIPETKTKEARTFTIEDNYAAIVRKYIKIRPLKAPENRFFIKYTKGRCGIQPIGKNTFYGMPKAIANFLMLDDIDKYTCHSFIRTSATILTDAGVDLLTLKRHGGWRSTSVVEGYVKNSINNKRRISALIAAEINSVTSTVSSQSFTIDTANDFQEISDNICDANVKEEDEESSVELVDNPNEKFLSDNVEKDGSVINYEL